MTVVEWIDYETLALLFGMVSIIRIRRSRSSPAVHRLFYEHMISQILSLVENMCAGIFR